MGKITSRSARYRKNASKGTGSRKRWVISAVITGTLILSLMFIFPVKAVQVSIETDNTIPNAQPVIFTISVIIEDTELLPIDNLTLDISTTGFVKRSVFSANGTPIENGENLTITLLPVEPGYYGYGYENGYGYQDYGYGYGHGYDPTSGYGYQFGYGYGYGYQQNYPTQLRYEVKWWFENDGAPDRDYTAILDVSSSGGGTEHTYRSNTVSFTIDTVPPLAPSLISLADGTITDDITPTFDWSDVAGAENYDLLVDDDADFSSPEIQVTVSVSTYTPTAGLPDDNYSWKVRARDAANNVSDWSSTWTLFVGVPRGVDVFISSSYQNGLPGATLSYTVTVKNEGNISDTYALTVADSAGWSPTLSKGSLALAPKTYDMVTLTVTIPTDASLGDQDNITITAKSTVDPTVSDSAKCTAQATAIRRRVEVSISPGSKSGPPEETLTYTITIVNEGDVQDTYDLTVTDALTWGATVSPTSLTLAAGSSDTATLRVTIPEGTASGIEDEITVKATSRADLRVSYSATCIASAAAVRGVEVSISPENQSGDPEETLTYDVTVKNEGNAGDTYILSVVGAPDWLPRVENTSLTLSAGKVGKTTLTVTIPPGASEGTSITVNVSAISVGDPTVTGSDTCSATVKVAPERPEVELPLSLALSVFLIGATIIVPASLLRRQRKKAARRRVFRCVSRISGAALLTRVHPKRWRRRSARRRVLIGSRD